MGDVTPFTRCQCGKGAKIYQPVELPEDQFVLCEECVKSLAIFHDRFKGVAAAMAQAGVPAERIACYMRLLMTDYLPRGLIDAVSTPRGML